MSTAHHFLPMRPDGAGEHSNTARHKYRLHAALLVALAIPLLLAACVPTGVTTNGTPTPTLAPPTQLDFAAVDPSYIYNQLFYMATHFQHRQAGYDNNLPVSVNGHDEFASYWAQEMQRDLAGFGPTVRRDTFHVDGWSNNPATIPAFNVEVTVPGVVHPEQEVVIGCHYDGEASSTQSANDDASGCAIELGVAKALGNYWRSRQLYPARTLRFVIFDAEEQGLFGSFHYLNQTVNGDTANITAMFNEEQNGIAYPLRFLGQTSNPVLPLFVYTSPLQADPNLYTNLTHTASQTAAITNFDQLMRQALPNVFGRFQQLGYTSLTYHDDNGNPIKRAIFSQSQLSNIQQAPDTLGSSDQVPFTMAGLPCATIVGNSTYYDSSPPPWSYPFDQPQDTIQMMNTFANDTSSEAPALTLSLAIPGMITTWMLQQPSILGVASPDGKPIAAISDIGQSVVGQPLALDAHAAYDPANQGATFGYAWNFGDGASGQGVAVSHTYSHAGTYTLTLTVRESSGASRVIHKTIIVSASAPNYPNPYAAFPSNGIPPSNPAVTLPPLGP